MLIRCTAMNKIPFFKKSDIVIIAVCLLLGLAVFLPNVFKEDVELTAVITADGETVAQIKLGEGVSEEIEVSGAVITVKGKEVYFSESDCPDKTCIKTGILDSAGDSSACVPNRVSVSVKGEKDKNGVDIIAY